MVTTEDLDDRLQQLTEAVEKLSQQLDGASDGLPARRGPASHGVDERRVARANSSGWVQGLRWSPATSTTSAWMALASARCFPGRTSGRPVVRSSPVGTSIDAANGRAS